MARSDRRVYWSRILLAHTKSGQTFAEFCWERHVSEASFYDWRKMLSQESVGDSSVESTFAPLSKNPSEKIPSATEGSEFSGLFEIDLPCGAMLRLSADDELLRRVLTLLVELGSAS